MAEASLLKREGDGITVADAFDAGLHDLAEALPLPGGPVYVLLVIDLLRRARFVTPGTHDGQGHVRLERQQRAVRIGKGDDLLRGQEILVPRVEVIALELAHFVRRVAAAAVKRAQREHDALLRLQDTLRNVHSDSSPKPRRSVMV